MSKIDDLIKEKCPNGVKFYKLSDIGLQFNGLSGKSKKDFEKGNYKYITYSNIYNNPSTKLDVDDYVNVSENEKQNEIQFKDILVAGSSENLGDSGMISVVTKHPNEKIFLNSFCFGFRLNKKFFEKYNADFLKHLFRDNSFRNEIISCSFGVTRYNLSKEKFLKIKIPCPSLEVQEEIARILDKFSKLEAELEAELEARNQQYEYWREKLLNNNCTKKKINELILKPVNIKWKDETENNEYFYIDLSSVNIENKKIENTVKINKFNAPSRAQQLVLKDDILFGTTRPLLKRVTIVPACLDNNICSTGYCVLRANKEVILPKWLMYNISTKEFYKYITEFQTGASYPTVSDSVVKEFKISVPSLNEQEQIVNTLDKFDKLVNDISEGLPAEIELRKKQYEYYRNKLLSFEELKNE